MTEAQVQPRQILEASERLKNVATYTLAQVFAARDEKIRQGVDVIDLGVGNPDLRPPRVAIDTLKQALDDPEVQNHRYPSFDGLPEFRAAIAGWYRRRFGVPLDPASQVQPLVGSKEGIFKFFLSHTNPGDTVLMCTPCYPAYLGIAALAQNRLVEVPLLPRNRLLPDLSAVPAEEARRAKLICVNFPNNPTGGVETAEFYQELLRFARHYELFVVSDIAYCDLSLDPAYRARSLLEFDREHERTVEFHSFSKSYSMPGWRVGFAAGNAGAVARLLKIKANTDFGIFMAIQRAATAVLSGPQDYCAEVSAVYRARRDAFLQSVAVLGYPVDPPRATLYVWMPIPRRYASSADFARDLLDRTGVVVAPGSGFGAAGEGFVRVALCDSEQRLREAAERMKRAGFGY
jgi:LL-diaminopimelate aminotransferase